MAERLLRMKKVAELLGISKRGVSRLIARGDMPQPVNVIASTRMPESEVEAYVDRLMGNRKG